VPIVFGAHILQNAGYLPGNAIIFNSEQYDSPWFTNDYIDILKTHLVLDYSYKNIEYLSQLGIDAHLIRLGYVTEEDRNLDSSVGEKDIDVLFYGSINQRRQLMLDLLATEDINLYITDNVFGEELDKLVARSKVVLNIHFYETKIFEIVRINYLLTNGVHVVSEEGDDQIEKDYEQVVTFFPYEDLSESITGILNNYPFDDQKIRSFMLARPQEKLLQEDFLPYLDQVSTIAEKTFPTIINIGSGKDFNPLYLNIDISPGTHPDIVHDITKPLEEEGIVFDTQRFGKIHLRKDCIDTIICNDVLEHLPDLVTAMTTCLTILKPGGKMKIKVPYDLSYGAWQDPTHVRGFNEESWRYFSEWCWYLGWTEATFRVNSISFELHQIGREMESAGVALDIIKRTPRAVDAMHVELEKMPLSSEIQQAITEFREHKYL
jgi:SAM-dependent methyltransferase